MIDRVAQMQLAKLRIALTTKHTRDITQLELIVKRQREEIHKLKLMLARRTEDHHVVTGNEEGRQARAEDRT